MKLHIARIHFRDNKDSLVLMYASTNGERFHLVNHRRCYADMERDISLYEREGVTTVSREELERDGATFEVIDRS